MFRLWFKTFFGRSALTRTPSPRPRAPHAAHNHDSRHVHHSTTHHNEAAAKPEHDSGQATHAHGVHESPLVMTVPLMILALLAVIGGWVGIPVALRRTQ